MSIRVYPRLIFYSNLWTQLLDLTIHTVRFARSAAAAAMPDEPVTEQRPTFLRHQLHQLLLNLHRVCLLCESKTIREPRDVRVHDHANIDTEGVPQNDVRRLAPDARECVQFIHRARHGTAKFFHERGAAGLDVLRLVAEKAGGLHGFLNFRERRIREVSGTVIFLEQFRCCLLYTSPSPRDGLL